MNFRPRIRFVNVNVKPNAIVIRVWHFGRPSASMLRLVRVVSIIKGKSLDIGVLCRGKILQLRKIRFKLGNVTSYGLNSFPVIRWRRFGWNSYDGYQKRARCYHKLCAPLPQWISKLFHPCSATIHAIASRRNCTPTRPAWFPPGKRDYRKLARRAERRKSHILTVGRGYLISSIETTWMASSLVSTLPVTLTFFPSNRLARRESSRS